MKRIAFAGALAALPLVAPNISDEVKLTTLFVAFRE